MMIALEEALSAVTATVEIPAHPGLQLDGAGGPDLKRLRLNGGELQAK